MTDEETRPNSDSDSNRRNLGTVFAATAIGLVIGLALFAATRDSFWIALGAGAGVAIGAAIRQRRG